MIASASQYRNVFKCGGSAGRRGLTSYVACLLVTVFMLLQAAAAHALQPIVVSPDQDRIEITSLGELYEGRGDSLQIETAAGPDGAVARMAVRAALASTNPNWIVFAITNPTDKAIERWVAADRYTITGSGAIWPDLDARRIEAITPSIGFVPERIKSERADVFRITLEPGQTITYVAEMSSERFARVYLWKPIDYELKARDKLVFNGVLLGLTGLLAVFLTAIFAANHKLVFPASALVAWCALAYLCVDFGFFHKLFQLKPEDNAVYRAAAESALAASLVIFLYVFLRLALWHGLVRMLVTVWMLAQLALIAVAVIDPRLAATFARVSFVALGIIGAGFVLFLAARGQDRALSLVPTWVLFNVWVFAAGVVLTGRLTNEMAVSGLAGGLVLILLLIGFTVTQYAFRTVDTVYGGTPSEMQTKSLALDATGTCVWEWNARRDEIKAGSHIETSLGLAPGELSGKTDEFVKHMHEGDSERFRLVLLAMRERNGGDILVNFRLRHADNSYRWFEVEAASVPGEDANTLKCVGLIRDVTDTRRAHDRLVRDAVNCSLTGLPHRELLLDRLGVAMRRARSEPAVRPTLITVGLDKFKGVNTSYGAVVGDSLILTVARRLQRHIGEQDTLARVGGDQFSILLLAEQTSQDIAALAERIRRSLRSPITMAGREIVLTGSLGIAIYDGSENGAEDLLKASESALYSAKRGGTDRVEVYKPGTRPDQDDAAMVMAELRKAIERNQIRIFYQPVVYLPTEELAGFEALVRWEHPKLGLIDPFTFEPVTRDAGIATALSTQVLTRAVRDVSDWQKDLPRPQMPLFVSVSLARSQLMREELATEIRQLMTRSALPKNALRIEIGESLVMENPEQADSVLEQLQGSGADLALDDFGAGYSSLSYLHKFPFSTLKIDRTMIQGNLASDSAGAAVVRSLVTLTHGLGKTAWADGVETADGASFLRGLGCEFGQGFYFGGLILDRDVPQLLRAIRKSESKLQPRSFFRSRKQKKNETTPDTTPVQPPAIAAKSASALPPGGAAKPPGARPPREANPAPFMQSSSNGHDAGNGMHPPAIPSPVQQQPEQVQAELMQIGPNPLLAQPPSAMPPPMPPMSPSPMFPPSNAMQTAAAEPFVPPPPMPAGGPQEVADSLAASLNGPPPGTNVLVEIPAQPPMPGPMPHNNVGPHTQPPMPQPPFVPAHSNGNGNGNGSHRPHPSLMVVRPQRAPQGPAPDLSRLPPSVADSLARLAGGRPQSRPAPVIVPFKPANK
jgi:diguanylate cyclase (GGDEF)-like protein/PAS domain S-box-containing protein